MLIILDLDGTVINSEKAHYNSFVKAIEKKGHKLNASQKMAILSKFGMDGKEIIKGALPNLAIDEINDISKDVKMLSTSEFFIHVKFIKGAKEFLEKNFKKHELALATNSSKEFTNKCIDALNLSKYFKKAITASNVKNSKPHPEMLNNLIKSLDYKKKDCVFIGDSIFDFIAAKKAKIRFIAVIAESDYAKELKENNAECFEYLIDVKL